MTPKPLRRVLQHVRKLSAVHTARGLTDGELLDRFLGDDDAAFAALVERHGPMVLGVCRRALGDTHDAEDACQATFLVLARKASSIRKKASLSSWLHGVASRVAATLKRGRARRNHHEKRSEPPVPSAPDTEVVWREVRAALDEELERLPESYRAPLILCYLDGRTRDEAAGQLGLTVSCLHGRLERGRNLLRERLTRRGLALSAALFAATLTEGGARAMPPPTLVIETTRAALQVAAGQTLSGGAPALTLAHEVLKTMFLTKLKTGAALLCAGVVVALLGTGLTSTGVAQETKPAVSKVLLDSARAESDEEFIRRISKDLRGSDPTAAEVHFFVTSKAAGKRQTLIDLFIRQRQAEAARTTAKALRDAVVIDRMIVQKLEAQNIASSPGADDAVFLRRVYLDLTGVIPTPERTAAFLNSKDPEKRAKLIDELTASPAHVQFRATWNDAVNAFGTIQRDFYRELQSAKEKGDVAAITQTYLDKLMQYVKDHPKSPDAADAMAQIVLVYASQGKTVEAEAWRAKLLKDYPDSAAAKRAKEPQLSEYRKAIYKLKEAKPPK